MCWVLKLVVLKRVYLFLEVPEIVDPVRILTLGSFLLLYQNESLCPGNLQNVIVIPKFDLAYIDNISHLVETFTRLL